MKTSIRGRQPVLAAVLKSTRLVHVGGVRGGGISLPVTMCSCISNFLLPESEVGRKEGRKEEEEEDGRLRITNKSPTEETQERRQTGSENRRCAL